jgi:hypothetical protein
MSDPPLLTISSRNELLTSAAFVCVGVASTVAAAGYYLARQPMSSVSRAITVAFLACSATLLFVSAYVFVAEVRRRSHVLRRAALVVAALEEFSLADALPPGDLVGEAATTRGVLIRAGESAAAGRLQAAILGVAS